MTEQKTHSPSPKPVYVRIGDWYILHDGKSEIKAFGAIDTETTAVVYAVYELEEKQYFPDFCDRMREVAELVG